MTDHWNQRAPLTGVLFAVLVAASVVANNSYTPKASASAAKVVSFYTEHHSAVETSGILIAFAYLVLVLYAGALRAYLRRTAESLGTLVLAGGVMMATGGLLCAGIEYGLAYNLRNLSPEAIKTLNFVSTELFLPVQAGEFVFGVCGGLAILRGAALPKWLGWVAIVIGVVVLIPSASFYALLTFAIWSIVVSILVYRRLRAPVGASTVPQPAG
jgi:hypothetical protein